MGRLGLALKSFFTILKDEKKADKIQDVLSEAPSEGIQLLSILQREGRFVDFIQENITRYSDAQIGAAVRTVHEGCKKALQEVVNIESIKKEPEGSSVTIERGFDPSVIRLTGHVFGDPPFSGILNHHGWRVVNLKFPKVAKGQDPAVIAPAEVEIPKPSEESRARGK